MKYKLSFYRASSKLININILIYNIEQYIVK